MIKTKPGERRRPHIRNNDVSGFDQPVGDCARARFFEISANVAFSSVEMEVGSRMLPRRRLAAEPAHQISFRAFKLDHFRAVGGEARCTDGANNHRGQV
jgi:hypothetical protein